MDSKKRLDDLEARVQKLEASLSSNAPNIKNSAKETDFSGPKGAVMLFINEGFLNTPKTTDEVKAEMEKQGYYYKRHVTQTALTRMASGKGALTVLEKDTKKAYVVRK